jgi:hypothetical protein
MISTRGIAERGIALAGIAQRGIAGEGGVLLPAAPDEIIQWLKGIADGRTLLDKKDIVDPAELRDVDVLTLDGVGDYGDLGTAKNAVFTDAFTIRAEGSLDSLGAASTILSNYDREGTYYGINFRVETTGEIRLLVFDSNGNFIDAISTGQITAATWCTVVASWDGTLNSNAIKLWIDGVESAGTAAITGSPSLPISASPENTKVGAHRTTPSVITNFWAGDIGITSFRSGVYTPATWDYSGADGIYPVEEGADADGTLYDASSNSNHGALVVTSSIATIRAGKSDDATSWNHWKGFRGVVT